MKRILLVFPLALLFLVAHAQGGKSDFFLIDCRSDVIGNIVTGKDHNQDIIPSQ